VEVRFAELEMDDRAALSLELLGPGKHGERAFALELCDTGCDAARGHAQQCSTARPAKGATPCATTKIRKGP